MQRRNRREVRERERKIKKRFMPRISSGTRTRTEQRTWPARETKSSWFTNQPRNATITIPWNVLRTVVSKGFYSHVLGGTV